MESQYFLSDGVTETEQPKMSFLLDALYNVCNIDAFYCSQHQAIVFYYDNEKACLITPHHLSKLLQDSERKMLTVLNHVKPQTNWWDLESWSKNYIRLASLPVLSTNPWHTQPDPSGSLLRRFPTQDSPWVSSITRVPNSVRVKHLETQGKFSLIGFETLCGWVEHKYLS